MQVSLRQVWNVAYAGRMVRMRVASLIGDQVVLVEEEQLGTCVRALVTPASRLSAIAELAEDAPTVEDMPVLIDMSDPEDEGGSDAST